MIRVRAREAHRVVEHDPNGIEHREDGTSLDLQNLGCREEQIQIASSLWQTIWHRDFSRSAVIGETGG